MTRLFIGVGWIFFYLNLLITVHFIIEHTSVASIVGSGYLKKIRIREWSVPTYFKNVKEPSIFETGSSNFCEVRAGGRSFNFLPLPVIYIPIYPVWPLLGGWVQNQRTAQQLGELLPDFHFFKRAATVKKGKKRGFF